MAKKDKGAKKAAQAQAEAAKEAAKAAQEQALAVQEANTMQENFAVDLAQENMGQVVAGGVADVPAPTAAVKKKRPASALSSQLGIE